MKLRPNQLIVRGYAEKHDDLWVAVCIDFGLAAQADSLAEARRKLDEQIKEYVYDALVGEDREFAGQLLTRRASLAQVLRYHVIMLALKFHAWRNGNRRAFEEQLPLVPAWQ